MQQRLRYFAWESIKWLPVALVVRTEFGCLHAVHGPSMMPTLEGSPNHHDYVFVRRQRTYHIERLKRGQVVTLLSPTEPRKVLVKRIIGMPGDMVIPRDRTTKRNGVTVPQGHVWVEGDNENGSTDSNQFGPVPAGLIWGKVKCICFPPGRWSWVSALEKQHPRVHFNKQQYISV